MKKMFLRYALIIASIFLFGNTYGQITDNEDGASIGVQERLVITDQLKSDAAKVSGETVTNSTNNVFIQQIGVNNTIFSNINATSSSLKLIQNGEDNLIDIDETSREAQKFITQNGDYNTIVDYVFDPEATTNLNVLQEGNNLYFERFGSNELTKNLKFNMTGNARSIIIRSF